MAYSASIVVMAKEPEAGQVKTRLCPPLSPLEAAGLYDAFLGDTLHGLARLGLPLRVYGSGSTMRRLSDLADPLGASVQAQVSGHLGQRMAAAIEHELANVERVVVVGADSPDLPPQRIEAGLAALDRVPVCLGPARDGGYYLLAARERTPTEILGAEIPWGSDAVLESTRAALAAKQIAHAELDTWWDVDEVADLTRLRARLDQDLRTPASRTRSVLDELVRAGRL